MDKEKCEMYKKLESVYNDLEAECGNLLIRVDEIQEQMKHIESALEPYNKWMDEKIKRELKKGKK